MNNLIPLHKTSINDETINTISARDLHEFLESGQDYSTWIKSRIEKYQFIENTDFVCSTNLGSKGRGGHNAIEYHISLDMAKELAMVENNDKGREARRYFIDCEKRAKSFNPANLSRTDILKIALEAEEEKAKLQLKIEEDKPKVEFSERHAKADGWFCLRDAAKQAGMPPQAFNRWLHANGFIFKQGNKHWMPYSDAMKRGLLDVKTTIIQVGEENERASQQCMVLPKGIQYFAARLRKDGVTV